MIWERLLLNSEKLIKTLNFHCEEYNEEGMERFNDKELGWVNRTWQNESIRRAHIDIVDVRDTKGLWMMHVCIFPEKHNDGPIFGWDVIAGKNKVTGAFYDWSPMLVKDHYMTQKFIEMNKPFKPTKQRELPDWALKIFSPGMMAAGNITTEEEINTICGLVERQLKVYLDIINNYDNTGKEEEVINAQNYYCEHQQQNPHTPRVMMSLGLPEETVKTFCTDNLFPKI
jgi:phycocyanobilin:ferredoxin oxidoreductase